MNVTDLGMMQYRNTQMTEADRLKRTAQAESGKKDKLKEACIDFESIFIKQMLDTMRKTVNKTGLMGDSFAGDIFEDMLYDEYAKKMAKTANFGLSDLMYKQLSKNHTISG